MKSKLNIMDHSGHTTTEFDGEAATSADGIVDANHPSVKEAMERFNELVNEKKYTAGKRVKGGDGKFEIIRSFDPNAEEIIMMPPLVGG